MQHIACSITFARLFSLLIPTPLLYSYVYGPLQHSQFASIFSSQHPRLSCQFWHGQLWLFRDRHSRSATVFLKSILHGNAFLNIFFCMAICSFEYFPTISLQLSHFLNDFDSCCLNSPSLGINPMPCARKYKILGIKKSCSPSFDLF